MNKVNLLDTEFEVHKAVSNALPSILHSELASGSKRTPLSSVELLNNTFLNPVPPNAKFLISLNVFGNLNLLRDSQPTKVLSFIVSIFGNE